MGAEEPAAWMELKTCRICKEDWPPDGEFYWKPSDLTCRACKYEQRLERTERDQSDPARREAKNAQSRLYRAEKKRLEQLAKS